MRKIGTGAFVRRQTQDSKYSHFSGSWDELECLVKKHFDEAKPGYRDWVKLVPVPAIGFFSGVVEVTSDTLLRAEFLARRKGEEPYLQIVAVGGDKLPARAVNIVVYRRDVITNGGEKPADAEWEIVSLNASTAWDEPLTPMAMARNILRLPGGTAAEYTAEEFARAIIYWSKRAMRG